MNEAHTWIGVIACALLFAIFWMGTLSVFDREIDRWMMPVTRLPAFDAPQSLEPLREPMRREIAGKSAGWGMMLPSAREPFIKAYYRLGPGIFRYKYFHPQTLAEISDPGTLAGTQFIFPFHYSLHLKAYQIGPWLVGLAGMAMMALCVSGVFIHRKIFAEFFVLRPRKKPRLIQDIHNASGVLGIPFHFMISLSGLIIFFAVYFPWSWQPAFDGNRAAFNRELYGGFSRAKVGTQAELLKLDDLVARAAQVWGDSRPAHIFISNAGDAAEIVEVTRTGDAQVAQVRDTIYVASMTGDILHRAQPAPVMAVQRFIAGLHFIQFRHWTLRWIYFALGLSGCLLIATGFLSWIEARRKKHAQLGLSGVRVVEALAVGSVTGLIVATLSFLIANRVLPIGTYWSGLDRATIETWIFFFSWVSCFVFAWQRPRNAWINQSRTAAALAIVAASLNWMTTGDHPIRAFSESHLWAVGGIDVMLILFAVVTLVAFRKVTQARANIV